ncbi:MAG: GNAT family N-acetyltransferase, partial [Sphaerospermopsis kisseleviana]
MNKYYQSGKDYRIYTAHLNGDTISALLLFYAGEAVEYYTPVIVEKYRDKQALSLIIYTAMIDASINGYKHWNWGGTWTTQQG